MSVSERPLDPARPVVGRDETSRQQLGEGQPPLPPAPGRPARRDPESVRGGVAHLLLVAEPLRGWRAVQISQQRTRRDFACCVKQLVDVHYPEGERIVRLLDHRNTHFPASLYAAFSPAEAKRLADKLEIHFTPKHGSWLNIAEIELAVLQRQSLGQRFGNQAALVQATTAWTVRRNAAASAIDWRFTTADARIKLKRLYPTFEM